MYKNYGYFLSMDEHCRRTGASKNMVKVTTRSRMQKNLALESHSKCELYPSQGFVI